MTSSSRRDQPPVGAGPVLDRVTTGSTRRLYPVVSGIGGGMSLLHPLATAKTLALIAAGRYAVPSEFMRKLLTGFYNDKPAALAGALRRYGVTTRTAGAAVATTGEEE